MITPKNTKESLMLWAASFILAILLSFFGSLAKQLPGTEPIQWRIVLLDVITTIITVLPILAAGLGLPRIGAERRATLIDEIGKEKSTRILEELAASNTVTPTAYGIDYGRLADAILERRNVEQPT